MTEKRAEVTIAEYFESPNSRLTPEMEAEFFASLRLPNGTFKTTVRQRFPELNSRIIELVHNGAMTTKSTLDIAVSSGVSTLEFYQDLCAVGYKSHIVATDLVVDAYVVRLFPRCFALLDQTGAELRFDLLEKAVGRRNSVRDRILNAVLRYRSKKVVKKAGNMGDVRRVKLVVSALHSHPDIVVQEDNIAIFNRSFEHAFTFVRAANILNKGYFSEHDLRTILRNIKRYVVPTKGHLLVVRTVSANSNGHGINHGTLFSVDGARGCAVVERFGNGSEIEDIVLDL